MPMYPKVDFSRQPRVENAPIARGFVTRKWAETNWIETLIQLPMNMELTETDSVRHYTQWDDGVFHEFYGAMATGKPVYVAAVEFDPELRKKHRATKGVHLYELPIRNLTQPDEKVHCPECKGLTDTLRAHFVELHVCRNVRCQHVFVVNTEPVTAGIISEVFSR